MDRREFLKAGVGAGALGLINPSWREAATMAADGPPKRVGLIGCGWYGKADLFRLIQVAPVEVVSLCDVDKKMLDAAADTTAERQASKKRPRTHGDYRAMLKRNVV